MAGRVEVLQVLQVLEVLEVLEVRRREGHVRRLKPSKCVFYVFITSVYAHAFNSIDFPVTSH